jgi:hypothetical protein
MVSSGLLRRENLKSYTGGELSFQGAKLLLAGATLVGGVGGIEYEHGLYRRRG